MRASVALSALLAVLVMAAMPYTEAILAAMGMAAIFTLGIHPSLQATDESAPAEPRTVDAVDRHRGSSRRRRS